MDFRRYEGRERKVQWAELFMVGGMRIERTTMVMSVALLDVGLLETQRLRKDNERLHGGGGEGVDALVRTALQERGRESCTVPRAGSCIDEPCLRSPLRGKPVPNYPPTGA